MCTSSQVDLLGLVELVIGGFAVYGLYKLGANIGITNQGIEVRAGQHADDGRFRAGDSHHRI